LICIDELMRELKTSSVEIKGFNTVNVNGSSFVIH
jgi:hypothetical protein